jgi:outer membrane protein assembly factor BamE (lipoprotein component of BamABCDE complex)
MTKRIILFLLTALFVSGCASNKAVSHNNSTSQRLSTQEGLQSLTKQIPATQLIKTVKKEAWYYVETTSKTSAEDAHAKAMKIINNPKNYSKKQLAVWENLTAQPYWKWFSWSAYDGTIHLLMYIVESDLK